MEFSGSAQDHSRSILEVYKNVDGTLIPRSCKFHVQIYFILNLNIFNYDMLISGCVCVGGGGEGGGSFLIEYQHTHVLSVWTMTTVGLMISGTAW